MSSADETAAPGPAPEGHEGLDPERRIAALERENRALRAANAKLMRERLGRSDTAAASELAGPARRQGPVGAGIGRALAPLRRLRLLLRRILLRLLR